MSVSQCHWTGVLTGYCSLSKTRRKRPVPEEWATPESISAYTPKSTSPPFYPGGTVLAVHAEGDTALVAGNDGACGVISLPDDRVLHALDLGKSAATSG